MNVELFGYTASILIAISFLMVSILKLRIINLFGCLFFVLYGVMIGSPSIILANTFITGVQIYQLMKMWLNPTGPFTYLSIQDDRKGTVRDFIGEYSRDVTAHYPLYSDRLLEKAFEGKGRVFLALKKTETVGFAFAVDVPNPEDSEISEEQEALAYIRSDLYPENTLYLNADYILKKYRDMGIAQKLYEEMSRNLDPQIKFMAALGRSDDKKHGKFLVRNGYDSVKAFGNYTLYVKSLA